MCLLYALYCILKKISVQFVIYDIHVYSIQCIVFYKVEVIKMALWGDKGLMGGPTHPPMLGNPEQIIYVCSVQYSIYCILQMIFVCTVCNVPYIIDNI